jgi:hypothetical protein
MLRLEISQRWQPATNFARAYEGALKFVEDEHHQLLMMQLFMSAPILGRWKDFVTLGPRAFPPNEFEAKMEEFHETTLTNAGQPTQQPIFDCKILWKIAQENKGLSCYTMTSPTFIALQCHIHRL